MPPEEPEKGDKVSWNWGGGAPGGTVAEVKKEGEIAITSKRGNKIKKNAEPSNPAVHVERSGNDVVKRASELNIEEKASGSASDKKEDAEKEVTNGEKRKHDEVADKGEEKKDEPLEENAEGKTVKPGGPAAKKQKNEAPKKEAPKKEPAKGKNLKGAAAAKHEEKKEEEEKNEEAKPVEKKEEAKPAEKKKAGRPKAAASGAAKKQKKDPTPRSTEGIGSRTRSRA